MITVLQRTSEAHVVVGKKIISKIKKGLVLLVGVYKGDDSLDVDKTVDKIINLRIFSDQDDKINLSIQDVDGEVMVISQFTLCGDIKKGRRPSFINAESPKKGLELYQYMVDRFRENGINTVTGEFGAMMDVSLINEGPSTFVINSKEL